MPKIVARFRLPALTLLLPLAGLGGPPLMGAGDSVSPVFTSASAEMTARPPGDGQPDVIGNSVVKVISTVRYPMLMRPWTRRDPTEISGSGMVIDGHRILTNAHVVLYAGDIQIQSNRTDDRSAATVEAVAPAIDLAILKLDDESFFTTHPPLKLAAELPRIKDPVLVYGYPTGGASLSITRGIVSRIEYAPYGGAAFGLRIQIDAAINPGNSGGPAMVAGNVIGLAFSFLSGAQNIGYIIPTEEIGLLLKRGGSGRYGGRPDLSDQLQVLENSALRRFLKLDASVHGVVVASPDSSDPAYPLKRWDVITQVGEKAVDDRGMVALRDDLQVPMSCLFQGLDRNGAVPAKVVRGGRIQSVNLPVSADPPTLFPDLQGAYPSYFIFGPLVFSRASTQLVAMIETTPGLAKILRARSSPLILRLSEKPAFPGEELVVVCSPFLPNKLSAGYSDPALCVVKAVNDKPIKNLRQLVRLLRDPQVKYLVFEFADEQVDKLVYRRADLVAATPSILAESGIRSQGSPDLMDEWNASNP